MPLWKNIVAASAVFAAFAIAAENSLRLNTTASGLDINDIGLTGLVSYANSTIWIGGIKSQIYSEPFLLQSGGGGISFTSFHGVPTGWQNGYIFPNETEAVGFTIPHGASIPSGASISGWGFDSDGYLTFNGENNFIGCQPSAELATLKTWQIWWAGENQAPADHNCTGKLYLYLDAGCLTVG